jgi:hypothetical protein
VIVEEDNGDVNISSPNGNVDFQTDDISNVGELTADSVSIEDLVGAKQVGQHNSIQAAIDAAGDGGTVVFDADGGPCTLTSEPAWYDGQTIILGADILGDPSATDGADFFDFSGLSGVTLVPNGHTLDGQDRSGVWHHGVRTDSTTTDCHVEGVLRATQTNRFAVTIRGDNCTVDTVIGQNIGSYSENSNYGDVVYFESGIGSSVERVISTRPARHAVTVAGNDASAGDSDHIGFVYSDEPGGAHIAFEEAKRITVGHSIGYGAQYATQVSSPQLTYSGYAAYTLINVTGAGTVECDITTAKDINPYGTAPSAAFGNDSNNNHIGMLQSDGAGGKGVYFSSGAGTATGNVIDHALIRNAADTGIYNGRGENTVKSGLVEGCQNEGVRARSGDTLTLGDVTVRNNAQSGGTRGAVGISVETGGIVKADSPIIEDTQGTATQTTAVKVYPDVSIGDAYITTPDITAQTAYDDPSDHIFVNGKTDLGGAPNASNYAPEDAGLQIVDTSTSPDELYIVLDDGGLSGPY